MDNAIDPKVLKLRTSGGRRRPSARQQLRSHRQHLNHLQEVAPLLQLQRPWMARKVLGPNERDDLQKELLRERDQQSSPKHHQYRRGRDMLHNTTAEEMVNATSYVLAWDFMSSSQEISPSPC